MGSTPSLLEDTESIHNLLAQQRQLQETKEPLSPTQTGRSFRNAVVDVVTIVMFLRLGFLWPVHVLTDQRSCCDVTAILFNL